MKKLAVTLCLLLVFVTALSPVSLAAGVNTNAWLYCLADGMPKYWLDFSGREAEGLVLHCYFRSGDPTFYESRFFLDGAKRDGNSIVYRKVVDAHGFDHSDWFRRLAVRPEGERLILEVEREESTLAGGAEDNVLSGSYTMEPVGVRTRYERNDNILSGSYLFEPKNGLRPAHDGPFTPEELCRWAQIRYFTETGFFPPEADFEKNNDGSYTIHLYEIVDLDAVTHTATSAWYSVDENGDGTDDIYGTPVHLAA